MVFRTPAKVLDATASHTATLTVGSGPAFAALAAELAAGQAQGGQFAEMVANQQRLAMAAQAGMTVGLSKLLGSVKAGPPSPNSPLVTRSRGLGPLGNNAMPATPPTVDDRLNTLEERIRLAEDRLRDLEDKARQVEARAANHPPAPPPHAHASATIRYDPHHLPSGHGMPVVT